ncbi:hypothetical protein CVH10_21435, partial [Halomonas sp. ND22Bw]
MPKPEEPKICKIEALKENLSGDVEYRSEGLFRIKLRNTGNGTCANVRLEDDLDDTFKFLRQESIGLTYLSNFPELTPGPKLEWKGS